MALDRETFEGHAVQLALSSPCLVRPYQSFAETSRRNAAQGLHVTFAEIDTLFDGMLDQMDPGQALDGRLPLATIKRAFQRLADE